MAVEIKELIVKVVAVENTDNKVDSSTSNLSSEDLNELTSHIIQQCVKEVLKIMERKASR